jgi:ABC-type uncharacterized transport system permease subunit/uroporphyrinogen-III decarboxylase
VNKLRSILPKFGWRLQRRVDTSETNKYLFKIAAIVLALLIAGFALQAMGHNALELGLKIIKSTLGTKYGREQVLILSTPIIITALAASLSAKVGLFNMGAEGQLFIGALAATAVGLSVQGAEPLILVLMMIMAALAAGVYALVPAIMRIRLGISEILSAIMLNYTAVLIVNHFVRGIWHDNKISGQLMSFKVPFNLPVLSGKLHIGILIAVVLAILIAAALEYSVWGYDLKSIAANKETARFAGISVKRYQLLIMFISGGIAGIAGAIQLSGVAHRLMGSISLSYGYHGLMVAILAGTSIIAIIPYGLFFALLLNSGLVLQTLGLSNYTVLGIIGLILLLSVIGDSLVGFKLVRVETGRGMPADFTDLLDFKKRTHRIHAAIELKKADRVPIIPLWGLLPAAYAGMSYEKAIEDPQRFFEINEDAIKEYEPDLFYIDPIFTFPGKALGALGALQLKWPGHGVGSDRNYQFVEGEYMKADEYDEFILDPSGFMIRKYIPRIYGGLDAFEHIPPPTTFLAGAFSTGATSSLINPAMEKNYRALLEAAEIANEWFEEAFKFLYEMENLGFPCLNGSTGVPPFDILSMMLRGSRGAMIDMYRQPEKIHAAMDVIQKLNIENVIDLAHESNNPRVSVFTYRGSDGFLSPEQFEEFYWPGAKEMIMELIYEGLTPVVHFEGVWDQRLDYLAELPAGKILGVFERTDLMKIKEVLTGKMCFTGGMPISLIQTGTPEEIREHTKKSIETLGQDGGYIMACSTSFTDQVPRENLKAWIEATKEYGVY